MQFAIVKEEVARFALIQGREFFHGGFFEEGVGFGHGGEGFGVARGGVFEDALDEDGGEAQAAVGGVDDEAREGADLFVDEAVAGFAGEMREVQGAVPGVAVEAGVREDGNRDGKGRRAAD